MLLMVRLLPPLNLDALHKMPIEWCVVDPSNAAATVVPTPGLLADLGERAQTDSPHDVIVLLPGEAVITRTLTVPVNQQKKLQQSAPYLLEEWIAGELSTVHVAYATGDADTVHLAAVDHALMHAVLEALGNLGLHPSALYADAAIVSTTDRTLSLLIDAERTLMRWGTHSACAIDNHHATRFMTQWLRDQGDTLTDGSIDITTASQGDGTSEQLATKLAALTQHTAALSTCSSASPHTSTEILCRALASTAPGAINLLQGTFASRARKTGWRHWRPTAFAAAAAMVMLIGFDVAASVYFQHRTQALLAEQIALYRELFPDEKKIVNARRQMASHLYHASPATETVDFLSSLARLTEQFPAVANHEALEIAHLNFNANKNQLSVRLLLDTVDQLETLDQRLKNDGIRSKISTATKEDERLSGKISLTFTPPS